MHITKKKQRGKKLLLIYCTTAVIVGIVLVIYSRRGDAFSANEQVLFSLLYAYAAMIVGLLLAAIYGIAWIIKNGYFSAKFSQDEVFQELDQLKQCYNTCEATVLRKIQIINWYYKPGGKVDRMIEDCGAERILKRQELLENRSELVDHFSSTLISAGHAVLITVFFQFCIVKEMIITVPAEIVFIIMFFAFVFLRYAIQKKGETYLSKVDRYELYCLQEKIQLWKTKFSITDDEMEILKIQRES